MKIVLGSDHAALELRHHLAKVLEKQGHELRQVGAQSVASYDYPDAADEVAEVILNGQASFGIIICGTGIGISIRANRHRGIRAALCTTEYMAKMAREHNHANVLALGARVLGTDQAEAIVAAFLQGTESDGERHVNRVRKLDA